MTSLFCIVQLCTSICACILMFEKKKSALSRPWSKKPKKGKGEKIWSCLYVNQNPKQTHEQIFWNIFIYKVLAASEMKPLHRVFQKAISVSKSGGGLIWPAFTLMLPTLHKTTKSHEEVNRIDFPAAPSPRLSDKRRRHKLSGHSEQINPLTAGMQWRGGGEGRIENTPVVSVAAAAVSQCVCFRYTLQLFAVIPPTSNVTNRHKMQ